MKHSALIAGAAAVVMILSALTSNAFAQDIELGEKVFKKCRACHMIGPKAKNRLGPTLNDIIGRKAASVDGFKFSKAMQEAGDSGLIWSEENLDKYLAKPRKMVPKTRMVFPGLRKEEDRKNVIAYLKTFSKPD